MTSPDDRSGDGAGAARPDELLTPARIEAMAAHLFTLSGAAGRWDDLDEAARAADRACAAGVPAHLERLGLGVREVSAPVVRPFDEAQVEAAAVAEHDRWAAFTRARGYRFGPARDDVARTHPDLVAWAALDEPTREKDRVRVRAIPDLLATVGLEWAPA